MSAYVEKLAASGQLSAEQVERIGQNVAAFARAFAESSEMQKEAAGLFDHIDWKATAGSAIALTGLHALQGVARDAVQTIKNSVTKARDYKAMMDVNPHLAQHDAAHVQRVFDTLHRFNPQYAADPLVAGTFVKNTIDAARMDMNSLNQIVGARKAMSEAQFREQGPDLGHALMTHDPLQMARDAEAHRMGLESHQMKQMEHGWKAQDRPMHRLGDELKLRAGMDLPHALSPDHPVWAQHRQQTGQDLTPEQKEEAFRAMVAGSAK